jgi:O-antigen/teichoic acid export membrane protein
VSLKPLDAAGRRGAPLQRVFSRVRRDLEDPLFRNAYALLANAFGTSVLGLIYWILAARLYSPRVVGASSALVAALLLASTAAQLNLGGALARFLPKSGSASRRLVLAAYLTCGTLSAVVAVSAMPWIGRMARDLEVNGVASRALLLAAVVVWTIFALQDHTLTGLRESVWVPAENALFGLLKILMLVALASSLPQFGIVASWTIPMALMLLPVNLLIFGRFLPRHIRRSQGAGHLDARQIGRFVAYDYAGSLLNLASSQLLPVLVAARIGSEANGYFYIAWVVMTTFDFALVSITTCLTVEGSHAERRLSELASAFIPRLVVIGVTLLAVLFAAAPQILSIFGAAYAGQASGLLRLLALGLIPRGAIVLWMSAARVQNRVRGIVAVQGALSVMVLGLSAALISQFEINGVGIAYLTGNGLVALVLLPTFRRLFAGEPTAGALEARTGADQAPEKVALEELSVVVPVKNAEAVIAECLASIVRSRPAEIIVVDGLSTDATVAIARRFPVRIISDGGSGLPVARTLGASAANSRWVALVDSDLMVGEGALEDLIKEFETGGYVGLQAGLRSVSGKGYWGRALANHHRFGLSKRWFGVGMTIFRREQLLAFGFDSSCRSGEDVELRLRLKDMGARIGVSSKTVAVHRFQDDFAFAKGQWVADGTGLARVMMKRGVRSCWLFGLPIASAVWGVIVSLVRLQPQWIPYFAGYLFWNYRSMLSELFRSLALSRPSMEPPGSGSLAAGHRVGEA